MRHLFTASVTATALVALSLAAIASADEEKIPLDKLPKVVLDAVKAKFPDAELTGAEKDDENGKIQFEVALKHKGHKYEVIVTPEGKIVAIEKEIAIKDLPKAVTAALAEKYPKATYKKAEEITKGEKLSYEVLLVTAQNTQVEVVLDPSGKILEEEIQKKEEKKKEAKSDKNK